MKNIFYKKPFIFFYDKIKNNEHFKYSRFNDGELIAIIGKTPNNSNCDGHVYFPKMGVELKNVLLNYEKKDDYILESFIYWYNILSHIKEITHQLKEQNNDLFFLEDDFIRMSHENEPENFIDLLKLLSTKKLVLIGPDYLIGLNKYLKFKHIVVPRKNCYLEMEKIIHEINNINLNDSNNIFLFSASMATNIIIDNYKKDKKNTYLDWGSVWDTFFVSPEYSFIRKRSSSNKKEIINKYENFLI